MDGFHKQGIDRLQKEKRLLCLGKLWLALWLMLERLLARGKARVFFTVGGYKGAPSFPVCGLGLCPHKICEFGTLICRFQCIVTATKSMVPVNEC